MNTETFLFKAKSNIGGSASPHINVGDIKNFKVAVPPLGLQTHFADFVRQADKSKFEMQRGLDKLEIIYKSLMQKCFNAEVTDE